MATTNYTITGTDFIIKSPLDGYFDTGGLALVQWEAGYDPKYRPLSEWTSSHLTQVSWTGWYEANHFGVGKSLFGSNGTPIDTAGPLYLFIDFNNSSNFNPVTMQNQVWMGQITDILANNGGDVVIDLNTANIRSVVGSNVGNILISQDFSTWTPSAVPEPSYASFAVILFAVAVLWKKLTKPKKEAQ